VLPRLRRAPGESPLPACDAHTQQPQTLGLGKPPPRKQTERSSEIGSRSFCRVGEPVLSRPVGVATLCCSFAGHRNPNSWGSHIPAMPGSPLARGSTWAGGRDHTPSRVPQQWGTTSCREVAPLTPHAQPGTPAVGNHQLSRGRLHLHHTPSRVPQRWSTTSCRETAPLTPHAQPGTPAVGYHQLSRGRLHLHHTPSQVPQRWGTTSCREADSTYTTRPASVPQRWSTTSCREADSTNTTRPAGYPSGGVPPAVERQTPLTPHAQPGTPAVGHHQLSRGRLHLLAVDAHATRLAQPHT
jgi:hypothetical protein